MTLILTFLTHNYVMQVADRRLTWVAGPNKGNIAEDNATKTVLFNFRATFSYTGLAEIGGVKTDKWLASTLAKRSDLSLSAVCNYLAECATTEFAKINIDESHKLHAFVCAGWAINSDQTIQPVSVQISNMQSDSNSEVVTTNKQFQVSHQLLDTNSTALWQFNGAGIPRKEWHRIRRTLTKIANRTSLHPQIVLRVLIAELRQAAKVNFSIGEDLLAVCIPRKAVSIESGKPILTSASSPILSMITHLFLPKDNYTGTQYMPHAVMGGSVVVDAVGGSL